MTIYQKRGRQVSGRSCFRVYLLPLLPPSPAFLAEVGLLVLPGAVLVEELLPVILLLGATRLGIAPLGTARLVLFRLPGGLGLCRRLSRTVVAPLRAAVAT